MTARSTLCRSFPTLRHLPAPFLWFFRSRRRVATAAVVPLAMILALPLWWSVQLVGLPDIGDPFDVEEFRWFRIPDDRNAFVLYRQAADRLDGGAIRQRTDLNRNFRQPRWAEADPVRRGRLEANREAMELYRRGSERPDAHDPSSIGDDRPLRVRTALSDLTELALLEASRLEERGEMAGGWTWYRAALRSAYHRGLRGSRLDREAAQRWQDEVRRRAEPWAADPRTTPAMLRRALDDVVACRALVPSESYTLKADFWSLERDFYGPGRPVPAFRRLLSGLRDWHAWRRERERSLRVMRLAVANWLAYEELPPDRRPPPSPDVLGPFDFYAFGPESPAGARALSPAALGRWLATTSDAQIFLRARDLRPIRLAERTGYRDLVVLLASELYRRDHGTDPPTDRDLVGPYLKKLPDDEPDVEH